MHFQEITSAPSTRPVTATGIGPAETEGDLYIKYKKLQRQLEFLQVGDDILCVCHCDVYMVFV